jgi:hypothetical protein
MLVPARRSFAERAVAAVVWELVAVDIGRLSNQESG